MTTAKELKEAIEKGAEIIEDEYGGTGLEVLKHAAILRAHLATIDEREAFTEESRNMVGIMYSFSREEEDRYGEAFRNWVKAWERMCKSEALVAKREGGG